MWKKAILFVFAALVVLVSGGFAYLSLKQVAKAPPLNITVERTPERIARGKYLFESASSCSDCHSKVDHTRFSFPIVPGSLGAGKELPAEMGLPGKFSAVNLTQDAETGTATWTDGQLIRAIREGIGHDDRLLFPIMPYSEYAHMSDEDVQSVVAYIRTLPAVKNPLPPSSIDFPVNLMVKGVPKPVGSVPPPNRADRVAYGKYLAKIGGCQFCHTPTEHNAPIPGKEFAGGHVFTIGKDIRSISANLTPDKQTGSGQWSEEEFLKKFSQYREYVEKGSPVIELSKNSVMPWLGICRMEDDDLRAIFAYLKTLPPISNAVVTHPDAPEEKSLQKRASR